MDGKFQKNRRIKFSQGKIDYNFILVLSLTPELENGFTAAPENINLVKIIDLIINKPVTPINVLADAKAKTINITYKAWDIIKYAQPGKTPIIVQVKLSDGRLAQADVVLETEWKLK